MSFECFFQVGFKGFLGNGKRNGGKLTERDNCSEVGRKMRERERVRVKEGDGELKRRKEEGCRRKRALSFRFFPFFFFGFFVCLKFGV